MKSPWKSSRALAANCRKSVIFVSPGGARSIWLRNDLETKVKRLKVLEDKVAQDGIVITEGQVTDLKAAKEEKRAHGQIETEQPGYLGSYRTFYVGTIKGVGLINPIQRPVI